LSPARRRLVLGVTWIVASALVWFLARSVDRELLWERLGRANPAWIGLALLLNFLIMICWTEQWRALLPSNRPVLWSRLLSMVGITAVIGNTIPASGQISMVMLLAREPGVTYASAVSVLALDQLLEAICKTALVLFAAALLPLPDGMKHAVIVLGIAAAISLAILILFANQKRYLVRFASELESLRNVRRLLVAIVFCLGAKLPRRKIL
jgi:hypothetical protein